MQRRCLYPNCSVIFDQFLVKQWPQFFCFFVQGTSHGLKIRSNIWSCSWTGSNFLSKFAQEPQVRLRLTMKGLVLRVHAVPTQTVGTLVKDSCAFVTMTILMATPTMDARNASTIINATTSNMLQISFRNAFRVRIFKCVHLCVRISVRLPPALYI